MPIVFALVSAASYGVSDFLGGLFAKKSSAWQVSIVGQSSSAVFAFILALFLIGTPAQADWLWAAAGGLGGGFGAAFLYRGLSTGRMSVVAVGLALGDRPGALAVIGIVFAFPAIYLISRVTEHTVNTGGVLDGVLAGLGFGALFTLIGQIDADAGLMPIALMQVTSVLAVILTATVLRAQWVPRDRQAWSATMMGPLGAIATGAFLYATHEGLLSIVSVIASLYPATTVLLAAVILHERIHRAQGIGLALAAAAVVLVAAG